MEGISSSLQNSDQTDSYFRTGFGSKKVSDDSKNNDGSNSESKEKEEEKTPPNQDLAHDLRKSIWLCHAEKHTTGKSGSFSLLTRRHLIYDK